MSDNKRTTTHHIIVNRQPISPHQNQSLAISNVVDGNFNISSKENKRDNVIFIALSTRNPINYFVTRASSVATFLHNIKQFYDGNPYDIAAGIGPFPESPSTLITELETDIKERCSRSNNEHNFGAAVKLGHILAVVIKHRKMNLRMFYSPICASDSDLDFDIIGTVNADMLFNDEERNGISTMKKKELKTSKIDCFLLSTTNSSTYAILFINIIMIHSTRRLWHTISLR